jgi:transposase
VGRVVIGEPTAGPASRGHRQPPDGPQRHRPSGAARLLGDVGDISRFPTRGDFASWNGTAPIDASSGDQQRHRLSRAGNRRINRVLHIMAIVQLRHETDGRAYYRRKIAAGKTSMEAMRCLKRRLSDAVYRQMVADTAAADQAAAATPEAIPGDGETTLVTDPGGQAGASPDSSAADSNPNIGTSEKSLPGPAGTTLRRPPQPLKTPA